MAQWVKNPTASSSGCYGGTGSIPGPVLWVKDLALLQLSGRLQLWLGVNPWPGNFFFFWPFLGPLSQHMEVPRLGV